MNRKPLSLTEDQMWSVRAHRDQIQDLWRGRFMAGIADLLGVGEQTDADVQLACDLLMRPHAANRRGRKWNTNTLKRTPPWRAGLQNKGELTTPIISQTGTKI
jgi:hypothetical protein